MDTETRVERSAGAAPQFGRLRVGARVGTVGSSKASIPTQFETMLNTDTREKNAFGCRTFRFEDGVNDLPGPGSYRSSRSIVNRSQQTLSCSTKGSAAFASRSKSSGPKYTNEFTPGPAAYSPTPPKAGGTKPDAAPFSSFAEPSAKRLLRVRNASKPSPGPGAYRPEDCTAGLKPGGKLTTLAPRDVGPMTGPRTAPGPGEFLPDSLRDLTSTSAQHGVAEASKRAGMGRAIVAARKAADAKPGLPPALVPELRHGELPDVVVSEAGERKKRATEALVAGALSPAQQKPNHASAVFAESGIDRFGRPKARYSGAEEVNVGPGTYDTDTKPKRMLISSSWALSTVDRGEKKARWAVPGPAYYKAEVNPPSHVSHHMLSSEYWS